MKSFLEQFGFVIIIIGIVMLVLNFTSVRIAMNESVDVYGDGVESAEDIKWGMSIETDMNVLLECFGSMETTTKNRSGSNGTSHTDYYYIMPVFVGEETYYVAFKVREDSDDRSIYKKISDNTMDYLSGYSNQFGEDSILISGGLHKLDDEVYDHMKDWFEDSDWFAQDSDIDKYVLPLVFEPQVDKIVWRIFYASVIMIVGGLAMVILPGIIGKKKKKQEVGEC